MKSILSPESDSLNTYLKLELVQNTRGKTCQQSFLESDPFEIPKDELEKLENEILTFDELVERTGIQMC